MEGKQGSIRRSPRARNRMCEASTTSAVVPAKAGTHNLRVHGARRWLRQSRSNYSCTCLWIPAFAGMTAKCWASALCNRRTLPLSLTHRFTCQTATPFPGKISPPTRRPYRALSAKRVDRFSPSMNEGDDAPKGAIGSFLAFRSGLAKALAIRASPFGAPSRLFCSRDRASGYWAGLMKVLRSGQAFACLHPHPSSRFRQSPVVGPDGDPRPPESVLARHVRGRRIQTPPRKRPREAPLVSRTTWNIYPDQGLSTRSSEYLHVGLVRQKQMTWNQQRAPCSTSEPKSITSDFMSKFFKRIGRSAVHVSSEMT